MMNERMMCSHAPNTGEGQQMQGIVYAEEHLVLCHPVTVVLSALLAGLSLCNILSPKSGRFIWVIRRLHNCCVVTCSEPKGVDRVRTLHTLSST